MIFAKKAKENNEPTEAPVLNPILIKKKDSYFIYLPEMSVGGEGKTLEEAYKQYELNLQTQEEYNRKYGLATISPAPYPIIKNRHILQELTIFFLKSALSVFAVILVTIVLLPNIGAAFRNQVTTLLSAEYKQPKYWAIQFPTQINNQLDRLDPEEEEKMLTEWNNLFERTSPLWKPFSCE